MDIFDNFILGSNYGFIVLISLFNLFDTMGIVFEHLGWCMESRVGETSISDPRFL